MGTYLIVGLPGVGKSTVLEALDDAGFATLDADTDKFLSQWKHRDTDTWTRHRNPAQADWNEHYDWAWKHERLQELLTDKSDEIRFIGGNAANVKDFYQFFQQVFALVLDDKTLTERIRSRGSGYGSKPDELTSILNWNRDFTAHEIARGATIVDARTDARSIAQIILSHIHDN